MSSRSKLILELARAQVPLYDEENFENLLFSPEVDEFIEENIQQDDEAKQSVLTVDALTVQNIECDSTNDDNKETGQVANHKADSSDDDEPSTSLIEEENIEQVDEEAKLSALTNDALTVQNIEYDISDDDNRESEKSANNKSDSSDDNESFASLIEEENSEEEDGNNKNESTGRAKRGRKRKHYNQTEKTRKILKNSNKNYISKSGNLVTKKTFIDYQCKCKGKCHNKILMDERYKIFEKFWKTGTYENQNAFICHLVKEDKKKRTRVPNSNVRTFSRCYSLTGTTVCKDMFIKTLNISSKRINTALKKAREVNFSDRRGHHKQHKKISDNRLNEIVNQISRIPTYISHYRRSETNKKIFSSDMTIEKMYEQYKMEVQQPVSISTYKHVFYTKFNISRKPLKKDTCYKCDLLTTKIENANAQGKNCTEKNRLIKEKDQHQKDAEMARNTMKNDFEKAKTTNCIEVLTFDMEKTLPLPRLPTGIVFYKRQLWLYNLGIHSAKKNKGYCFVWTEGTAGRGAQEVSSCLVKYVSTNLEPNVSELILWSDSCGGQNRNIKLTLMMKMLLQKQPSLQTIRIRFLVSGHSFLPNDKDFGDIEKALKYNQRIYTPSEYMEVMKIARKKNPLEIFEMEKQEFYSTKTLEKMIVNRKTDCNGVKIKWTETREIILHKNSPNKIFFKKSFEEMETPAEVDISKKKGKTLDFNNDLEILWPVGKTISSKKLENLKELMQLVGEEHRPFYENLLSDPTIEDDLEGYGGDVDFTLDSDEN